MGIGAKGVTKIYGGKHLPRLTHKSECQLPLSEASQGGCWLCTAGVNYRPHGVKGVPLRLAGAGSPKLNYLLPSSKGSL